MPQPLTAQEHTLITAAESLLNSIPRFSPTRAPTDHTCACACLSSDGRIFTGINTLHFTGGPCAETIAFGNAAAAGVGSEFSPGINGARLVAVVAVLSDERGVISPCGRCRQVMWDMHPQIRVIVNDEMGEGEEKLKTVGLEELLPYAYTWTWGPRVQGRVQEHESVAK